MTSATKGPLSAAERKQINITGMSQKKLMNEVLLNKVQFQKFRDVLNNLYKETSGDRDVYALIDTLYKSGEKSGLQGLTKARALFRSIKQAEELFPKSLYSEQKLGKLAGTLPEADLRKLKSLEKYLGIKFTEDAEKVALSKHAQAIADKLEAKKDFLQKAAIGILLEESTAGVGKKVVKRMTGL
jgi:hypothetical protein